MRRSLEGTTIVELASLLPGAYCGAVLHGLGARVIKIEPPTGDQMRELQADMFDVVNSGKESVVLDLKTDSGRASLDRILAVSQAMFTSFRRASQVRLGIDAVAIAERHPQLVHVSIAGFHRSDDPRAGHDINYLAEAGVVELFGLGRAADTAVLSIASADLSGALFAALAVVTRILQVRSGESAHPAEVTLEDAVVALTRPRAAEVLKRDPSRSVADTIAKPAYGTFKTADGRWVAVAAIEDHLWQRLAALLGLEPEIARLDYPHRLLRVREINLAVERGIARVTADRLLAPDVATSIAAGEVRPLEAWPLTLVIPGEPPPDARRAPALGEHTRSVLHELGVPAR